jgi:NADH:ubiquinone oxidoreductase subunit 5 (subunit L)/multisubunit Na+/H+ antiporter MnhA subunit
VLVLGAATALLGVAATFAQGDLKRLLAYSSIENIGIVFLGIGLAMFGEACGDKNLVVLGLGGAMFHVLNHSLFKPLLFLCAGSIIHATGTRELDQLGGLWRPMRRTGACFLVGACAISGLPLLNGFASEFVVYLGLFRAGTRPEPLFAALAATALGALAMAGGLAAATFVRSFCTLFLGRARSAAATSAHESPPSMTTPLVVLAVLCALVGLAPALCAPLLDGAIATVADAAHDGIAELVPFRMLSAVSVGCTAAVLSGLFWISAVRGRRREDARRSARGTAVTSMRARAACNTPVRRSRSSARTCSIGPCATARVRRRRSSCFRVHAGSCAAPSNRCSTAPCGRSRTGSPIAVRACASCRAGSCRSICSTSSSSSSCCSPGRPSPHSR